MNSTPRRAIAPLAALAALVLAAGAWAATGSAPAPTRTSTAPENGGTAAGRPTSVEASGGVAGPAARQRARAAQKPSQDEPPQVETTPTETTPSDGTVPETAPTAPDDSAQAPTGSVGGSGGGGLPHTGLELGALTAVGLGLLLAGLALRRRPTT